MSRKRYTPELIIGIEDTRPLTKNRMERRRHRGGCAGGVHREAGQVWGAGKKLLSDYL